MQVAQQDIEISTYKEDYLNYIKSRRRRLLRVLLGILLTVAVVFIPVNINLELWALTAFEMGIVLFALTMLYLLRKPDYLSLCCHIFVIVNAFWAIFTTATPGTDYSSFIWSAFVPALSFFLVGRKFTLPLCAVFIPFVVGIFLFRYMSGRLEEVQPLVLILNFVVYTILITVLYWYYESTRAHTEADLIRDIELRIKTENELKEALAEVKRLSGLLPVCSCCKKIRDDKGYWNRLEVFIEDRSEAQFSHGMCPNCAEDMYPNMKHDFESVYKEEFPEWCGEKQQKVDESQA